MLPANIVNALQTLVTASKPQLVLDSKAPAAIARFEPGQQLQASVQSKLPDGLFKVQVAGQTLQMRLPANIQAGDAIRLQVVSVDPKITFSIAASTNPLSTPEQIGTAARLLSNLSDRPIERPVVQQMGDKAVWAATQQAPDVKQLASGLREALSKSGLFYESHQAQWVMGERSTSQLLEEPQNQLTGKSLAHLAANVAPAMPDKTQLVQQPQAHPLPVGTISAKADGDTGLPINKADGNTGLPINKELLPLVQQQLHTLENHHMVWAGQVWPGQQMQWQIQGEPERHQGRMSDEREWSTEMDLSLPKLGDVNARLVFTERGLRLALHAADERTSALFSRALPQLRDALDNAGISLLTATVAENNP